MSAARDERRGAGARGGRLRPRADMRASVCEGFFAQAFVNLAGPWSVFITALALGLGAGGRALGFIFAAGPIMQGAQLFGPAVLPLFGGSRKAVVIVASALGRAVVVLIPLCALWLEPRAALYAIIICFLVSQLFMGISNSVWTAWIGAIVPDRIRGRFLGKRTQLITFFGLAAAFAASLVKDMAAPGEEVGLAGFFRRLFGLAGGIWGSGGERYAYVLIFVAAAAAGLASSALLGRQRDRPAPARPFSFRELAAPLRDRRFRRLLAFFGWWYFAITFGSPFWQPFYLEELGLSLTTVQLYNTVWIIAMAATAAAWGRAIDRFGNKPVFRALVLLSVANPLVYLFMHRGFYWWLWLEAISSGAMWGGAIIATMNLIIRLSPERARENFVAVYAVVAGACGLAGTIGSGQLIGMLPRYVSFGGITLLYMKVGFLGTAAFRLLAQLPMYGVAEPRAVPFRRMMRTLAGDARLWLARSRLSPGK